MFVAWLRGFLEGIGDNDLTPEQGERIIAETRRALGIAESPVAEAVVRKTAEMPSPKKGKPGKPISRADVLKAAQVAETMVPDMPAVERMG